MNFENVFSRLRQKLLLAAANKAAVRPTNKARLKVESLESREVPATLPAPQVDYETTRSIDNGWAPVTVQNPTNPNLLLTAFVKNADTGTRISLQYSVNGGTTWLTSNQQVNASYMDVGIDYKNTPRTASVPTRYTNVSNPSLTADRFNNFYLTFTESSADNTSGRVVLYKINFSSTPVIVPYSDLLVNNSSNLLADRRSTTVYRWVDTDPAYNPTVSVNSNLDEFEDPDTSLTQANATQSDPLAAAQVDQDQVRVFVAWNSVDFSDGRNNFNDGAIRMAISDDGGQSFAPTIMVNNNGNNTLTNPYSRSDAIQPKIAFTPGRAGEANSGGKMVTLWNDSSSGLHTDSYAFTDTNIPEVLYANSNPLPGNQTVVLNTGAGAFTELDIDTSGIDFSQFDPLTNPLDKLTLTLGLRYHNLQYARISLIAPNGDSFELVSNNLNPDGSSRGNIGFVAGGTEMGYVNRRYVGTTFNVNAARPVMNGTANNYSGTFRPAVNGFGQTLDTFFAGLTPAQLAGTPATPWKVRITNTVAFTHPSGDTAFAVGPATLRFGQNTIENLATDVRIGKTAVVGNPTGTAHPTRPNAEWLSGVGSGLSLAVNNTLGAYSPYQNRIYAGYNSGAGTYSVIFSDTGGQTWSVAAANLAGVNGTLAVDPVTGTLVAAVYNQSHDPSGIRQLTMVSTSVNQAVFKDATGVLEFSSLSAVNPIERVFDQIRVLDIDKEYVPSTPRNIGAQTFGNNMGLVAFGGNVNLLYAGNVNSATTQIRTQGLKIASGPRIVYTDRGPVMGQSSVTDSSTLNNSIAAGGGVSSFAGVGTISYNEPDPTTNQALFSGFWVEFDRVVDPSTFTAADVNLRYRAETESPDSAGAPIAVENPIPLDEIRDPLNNTYYGSKRFFIKLTTPRTQVGTYSYTIGELTNYSNDKFGSTPANSINDRIRSAEITYTLSAPVQYSPQPILLVNPLTGLFNTPNTNLPLTDKNGATTTTVASVITVPAQPPGTVIGDVAVRLNITHANIRELDVRLVAPNGQIVTLTNVRAAEDPADLPDEYLSYDNTWFSNLATQTLDTATLPNPPSTALSSTLPGYLPDSSLLDLNLGTYEGNWVLLVTDLTQSNVPEGTLVDWTLQLRATSPTTAIKETNLMDQNGNGVQNELVGGTRVNDVFALPLPKSNTPFVLPYRQDELPIIIPGPRVVGSTVFGQNPTADNIVMNTTASSIDIQFDRVMNTASFSISDIIRITGPLGELSRTGFNVIPIDSNGAPTTGNSRFYRIQFAPQSAPGQYVVQLASTIEDTNGNQLDTDSNAGLNVLTGLANTAPAVPQTYTRSGAPVTIPARGTATIPLSVSDAFLIANAQVRMTFTSAAPERLEARLISPDGSVSVLLFSNPANLNGTSTVFNNVYFTDDTSDPGNIVSIRNGIANDGDYNPVQPLAQVNGLLSQGTWKLEIRNTGSLTGSVSDFKLILAKPTIGDGVGDVVADQTSVGLRVVMTNGSVTTARNNWTPIGPDGNSDNASNGRVSSIAVDPSDTSGNTVYAAGASGGLWKTTNYLTRDPNGPSWIPLTDFGQNMIIRDPNTNAVLNYGSAINVGSLAVYNTTGDPTQTKIIIGTGSADLNSIDNNEYRFDGVGFLLSEDAGKTWQVLDSADNFGVKDIATPANQVSFPPTSAWRGVDDLARNHIFVGSVVNKIVFERNVNPGVVNNGFPIIYAAIGQGSTRPADNVAGLWRSMDGGRTWRQLFQGEAVDFSIGQGSAQTNTTMRPTIGYLAIRGTGILTTNTLDSEPTAGNFLNFRLMTGGGLRGEVNSSSGGIPVLAPASTPNGAKGKIVLVTPNFDVNNPLANIYYKNWLVAAVSTAGGTFDGLYMTKDQGVNWTRLMLRPNGGATLAGNVDGGYSDVGADADLLTFGVPGTLGQPVFAGNNSLALALDPNDPNIIYFGSDRVVRIDATTVNDPYKVQLNTSTDADGGLGINDSSGSTTSAPGGGGVVAVDRNFNPPLPATDPGEGGLDAAMRAVDRARWNHLNFVRDPFDPFNTNTALTVTNVNNFRNNGGDVPWSYVADGSADFDFVSTIFTSIDPLTGRARVSFGHDEGITTFVANDVSGTINSMNGFLQTGQNLGNDRNLQVNGARNGNMQVARLYSGDAQPSLLAASISQSLVVAAARRADDVSTSGSGILGSGNDSWTNDGRGGRANFVVTDQRGTGTVYILRRINDLGNNGTPIADFFQVQQGGQAPLGKTLGLFIDRNGLTNTAQWSNNSRRFAVNPIDGQAIVMSSDIGNIYYTNNTGSNWSPLPTPVGMQGVYYRALAFGPPRTIDTNINNYIYAGNDNGEIWVTQDRNNFRDITNGDLALDGAPIEKIIPNPTRNTNSAYAVTRNGVYFIQDWLSNDPLVNTWKNVTGNLFSLTHQAFGKTDFTTTILHELSSIAVDWRPIYSSATAIPVLYAAGDGGVFQSIDGGTTWKRYPGDTANATQGVLSQGGGLPNVKVTDIDLVLGNVDQGTGRNSSNGSPDMLVATTLGRGAWAIALGSPAGVSGPKIINATPTAPSNSPITFMDVEFDSFIDPDSFTIADVKIKTPAGTEISPSSVVNTSTPEYPGGPILNKKWRINFGAGLNVDGIYTVIIGPGINNGGGTLLNQNGNSVNGEPVTTRSMGDAFSFELAVGSNDLADYVNDTYQALYNRAPTTQEYKVKLAALEKARLTGLSTVIREILSGYNPATKTYAPNSDTARRDLITRLFNNGGAAGEIGNFLPGYSNITAFVNTAIQRLRAGQTSPELLTVDILTLTDYATAASVQFPLLSANDAWLSKVYSDLFPGLGINPLTDFSPSVLASRRTQASTLAGRKALATSLVVSSASVVFDSDGVNLGSPVLTTTNYRTHFINLAYQKYLGRLPSTKELSAARSAMGLRAANNLQGSERVYALILSSQEFFNAQTQNEPLGGDVADNGSRTNRSWVEAVYDARVFSIAPDVNGFISTDTERDYFSQKVLDTFKTARQTFVRSLPAAADVATGLTANRSNYRTEQVTKNYKLVHGATRVITDTEMASAAKFTALPNLIAARLASTEFASVITPPVGQQTMYTVTGVDPNTVTGTTAQKAATNANIWARAVYKLLFNLTLTSSDAAVTYLAAAALRSRTSAALAVLNAVDGATAPTKYKPALGAGNTWVLGGTYRERLIQEYFQEYLNRAATPTEVTKYLTFLRTNTWQNFAADLLLTRDFYEIVD